MNRAHHWICRSAFWRKNIAEGLLPWALKGAGLGSSVLEVGPGYGAATGALSRLVDRLTCVEIDASLARGLSVRMAGANVGIVQADALRLPFPDGTFSAAVCFTMLHHVPTAARQDLLLAEIARVLRPGALFIGTDDFRGLLFRLAHAGDTCNPVDPESLPQRLRTAGFPQTAVELRGRTFCFRARRA